MKVVEAGHHVSLDDYAAFSNLAPAVEQLRRYAATVIPRMRDCRIWMVNSTAEGGGVAELLPAQISLLCQLGLDVKWAVMESSEADFFPFTKRLHNLLHAAPGAEPTSADREMYERVSRQQCSELLELTRDGDIVVIHDPQPAAVGAFLQRQRRVHLLWRCHIGVDEICTSTRAAWDFLQPYVEAYNDVVFSLAEYVPQFLRKRTQIIHPSIDPLSHKNRDLSLHKLVGILSDADLIPPQWPLIDPPYAHGVKRLASDGSLTSPTADGDLGLLGRPIITQISRWDRLKGFEPLLNAFVRLKRGQQTSDSADGRYRNVLAASRLVLAGPDPGAVQDDPEAVEVFDAIRRRFLSLTPAEQADVVVLSLPLQSRDENALIVNALQRASTIVVQNSLREGFGLTVAEAMWKLKPMLASSAAAGVRLQVRDGLDGRLVEPTDVDVIATAIAEMLARPLQLEEWGRNAHLRVNESFLILSEIEEWLRLLSKVAQRTN